MFSLKKSLGGKITFVAVLVVIIITFLVKLAVYPETNRRLAHQAEEVGYQSSQHYAGEVLLVIENAFQTARTMGKSIEGVVGQGVTDRNALNGIVRSVLVGSKDALGSYIAFEPNALDGRDQEFANTEGHDASGRFVPYWTRDGEKIVLEPLSGYEKQGVGDYYQIPVRTNKEAAIDPYPYVIGGSEVLLTSFTLPLHDKSGKILGISGIDLSLESLNQIVTKAKPLGDGIVGIMTEKGLWVAHPTKGWAGKSLKDTDPSLEKHLADINTRKEIMGYEMSTALGTEVYKIILPFRVGNSEETWAIVTELPKASVNNVLTSLEKIDIYTTLILVVMMGVLLAIMSYRLLTVPMRKVVQSVTRIQSGDYKSDVPYQDRADEMGILGRALSELRDNSAAAEVLRGEQEEMKIRAAEEQKIALNNMADTFESTVGGIVEAVATAAGQLQTAAHSLSVTAEETNAQATSVAAATIQTSTNVQTVAAATEELASSISEISRQVNESSDATRRAVEAVEKTSGAVADLSQVASSIGDVIDLIRGVAEQTNLLALNATIEAARAGEMGKGFAVVAGEVKILANQTAQATDQIGSRINDIRAATEHAINDINNIQEEMTHLETISGFISTAVVEQQAATQEISGNVHQASISVEDVSRNISGVTEASSSVGISSSQVLDAATMLSEQAGALREEVQKFIKTVRSS